MKNVECSDNERLLYALQKTCIHQLKAFPQTSEWTIKQMVKSILKIITFRNTKVDRFFWPNGLLANALEYSHKERNDQHALRSLIEYQDNWIRGGLKISHIDNVINGYSMIYVLEKTGDHKYMEALDSISDFILSYPKDANGSLPYQNFHSQNSSIYNIYVDSLGMICPFLCRYGKITGNGSLVNLAINQLENFFKYGFDKKTNLPYHAYNSELELKLGIIGWGRAVGWLLIGLIDSLEHIETSNEKYDLLLENYIKLVDTVLKYQLSNGYFSWQLEATEGPIDTSSTSMIMYAVGKGIRINILDESYISYVDKSILALMKSTKNGYVENCSAECKGLGMYPQKYGWYPWSQGPTTALLFMFLH